MGRKRYILYLLCVLALAGTGCFSIPFLGGGGRPNDFEPAKAEFDSTNVFVGYDGDERPIVEIRLINQEVTKEKGLLVHARIFTTDNFEVVNIFRGLRSINYYPIERRFHRLELKYGRHSIKMKVSENLQIKGDKPIDATFEHTGVFTLLPDTIGEFRLKFQDVDNWRKMVPDSLGSWYVAKQQFFQRQERSRRRSSLVESYRRRQEDDYTKTFTQYDSLYVTTNNAYVFLEKDVASEILYTLNAGDQLDYGVSDGVWVEIPTADSLQEKLMPLFEERQRDAMQRLETQRRNARSSRGAAQPVEKIDTDLKNTGYILDVMVQKHRELALAWEMSNMMQPVDVPLFAQVLGDREIAEVTRRDSIAKAQQDSIKAVEDSLAALVTADSIAVADSIAAAAGAVATPDSAAAAVSSSPAAAANAADTTASAVPDTVSQAQQQPDKQEIPATEPPDDPDDKQRRRLVGPNGQVWEGVGPPPWSPRYKQLHAADEEETDPDAAAQEQPESGEASSTDSTGTNGNQP